MTGAAIDRTPSVAGSADRHLLTLPQVDPWFAECVSQAWRATLVNGRLEPGQSALLLYDAERSNAADFMRVLQQADSLDVPLAVWPAYRDETAPRDQPHALNRLQLPIDLAACRFRLSTSPHGKDPGAPWQLRRNSLGPEALQADLREPGLLFLQGHAGPLDGSFGRGLTLCGRDLVRPEEPALLPCVSTGRCFRQPPQGREETSRVGLIDPRDIGASLVVLDGCASFPVPGSLFPFAQSLLRGLLAGTRAGPCVISLGVSATPTSVIVLFMALLAQGLPLGRVVREVNLHRAACGSPSSCQGAGPWVLVGNPDTVVSGIAMARLDTAQGEHALDRLRVRAGDEGILLSLPAGGEGPTDIECTPPRWAFGAIDRSGARHLWLGPLERGLAGAGEASPSGGERSPEAELHLLPRDPNAATRWRETGRWLREGNRWLEGLRSFVESRVADAEPLSQLVAVRTSIAEAAENLACAATQRSLEIAPSLRALGAPLAEAIDRTDLATAAAVAHYATWTGARLSHLWAPAWQHLGSRPLGRFCNCGCEIVAHHRRHPLADLRRGELSCPACSLIADVTADSEGRLVVHADMTDRQPVQGGELQWKLTAFEPQPGRVGAACASLFDPYRNRRLTGTAQSLARGRDARLDLAIPSDWPEGMSWSVLIVLSGGGVSMFVFEVNVRRDPAAMATQTRPA